MFSSISARKAIKSIVIWGLLRPAKAAGKETPTYTAATGNEIVNGGARCPSSPNSTSWTGCPRWCKIATRRNGVAPPAKILIP
ncbi:hypothetical protein PF008_g28716, partial [Phytophthora fragariae]